MTASMLVEAIPFVFLGAVVGAAIEGFGFLYAGAFGASVLKRIVVLASAATLVGTLIVERLYV